MMITYSTTPQSLKEIWQSTWQLYKNSIGKVWYWIVMYFTLGVANQFLLSTLRDSFLPPTNRILMAVDYFIWVAVATFFLVISFVRMNSVTSLSENMSNNESIKITLKKLPTVFGTALIGFIIVMINTILFTLGFLYVGVYAVILVLPAIFLSCCLPFTHLTAIFNSRGAWGSFKHGIKLVWGNWWQIFMAYLVPLLVLSICLGLFFFLTGAIIGFFHIDKFVAHNIFYVFIFVVMIFGMSYFFALNLIIYNSLKLSYEQKNNTSAKKPDNEQENQHVINV